MALAFWLLPAAVAQQPEAAWLSERTDGAALALPALDPEIPHPAAHLGYRLGERFTRGDEIRGYFEALATASDRVSLREYGRTYEDRPLTLAVITSPTHQKRLEAIRGRQAMLADPEDIRAAERQALIDEQPAVVWLTYGIHGDESSSSEAAMATAYLLTAGGDDVSELLEDLVVVIDPNANPDGRARYVGDFEQRRGRRTSSDPLAAEHRENWPGGRFNHYLIDLNRDWSWATQVETRQRLTAYRAWEPLVHVDLHEMDAESSYFFPPVAAPMNPAIDRRVEEWLGVFGAANARAFDARSWLYFKAEDFDLFYPGYGDSYPSLRGAVGMTYEMAGGEEAGLAVVRPDGTELRLADRIARHLTTSWTTLRTAASQRARLLEDFVAGRLDTLRQPPTTYLWPADAPEGHAMARLLTFHGVRIDRLARRQELAVRRVGDGRSGERRFRAGSYAVTTAQPLGNLVRTLLDARTPLPPAFVDRQRQKLNRLQEPDFYDITAWSLPLAYGVPTWTFAGTLEDLSAAEFSSPVGALEGKGRVGYLVPWSGVAGYRAAGRLQEEGIAYRLVLADLEVEGHVYTAGSLFVPAENEDAPDSLAESMARIAEECGVVIRRVGTSFSTDGISLGSDQAPRVRPARIGLIGGPGFEALSFGSLWHLLDRVVEAPVTRLESRDLRGPMLDAFQVIILPDGHFRADGRGALPKRAGDALERWTRTGGLLIAVGEAVEWLRARNLTTIDERPYRSEDGAPRPEVPGAALATELYRDSPLAAGLKGSPAVLFRDAKILAPLSDRRENLLRVADSLPVTAGLVWDETLRDLPGALLVASETVGRGRTVVFAQDPAFRVYWRATMPLFLNAALHGPTWGVER
ncbi:MAG: M14 family zinc carboxypeptidase [Acidobacteriota bacterium]